MCVCVCLMWGIIFLGELVTINTTVYCASAMFQTFKDINAFHPCRNSRVFYDLCIMEEDMESQRGQAPAQQKPSSGSNHSRGARSSNMSGWGG